MVEAVQRRMELEPLSDEDVVARVLAGETALFEVIMRRYNQRVYRAARSIVRDEAQAEDVMQAAYVLAYEKLRQWSGRAPFGAWLTRIAVNEALGRMRSARRFDKPGDQEGEGEGMERFASASPDPEQAAATSEVRQLLQNLVDGLPEASRTVFVLRDVEGMTTAEASEALGISEENVKVRLHRARAALRSGLASSAIRETQHVFSFHASRCDRVVRNVFLRLDLIVPGGDPGRRI